MKKILAVTASIILVAAACNQQAAVQPAQNQQTQQPAPSTVSMADWQTYTNAQYGFQIMYPSNYSVSKNVVSMFGSTQAPAFSSAYSTMDFLLNKNFANIPNKTKVNGITAYESPVVTASPTGGISYEVTFQSSTGAAIEVRFITFDGKNNDKIAEFKQIISTFKFTQSQANQNNLNGLNPCDPNMGKPCPPDKNN
ncbi:MAG: hypothetical protein WDN47_02060 [Candidatus Doudnabacteria bacterium]